MRRVVAVTLVLLLITANVATISDTSFKALKTYPSNLGPALVFGPTPDGSPHRKNIVIGSMFAAVTLRLMDEYRDIDDTTESEDIVEAAKVIGKRFTYVGQGGETTVLAFFSSIKPIEYNGRKTHLFYVPMEVVRNGFEENYIFVFSSRRPDKNSPFPQAVCTWQQFKDIKDEMAELDLVPEYQRQDKEVMAIYENQEGFDKNVLEFAFDGGAEIEYFEGYPEMIKDLLGNLNVKINSNGHIPIEERRAQIIKSNPEIDERRKSNPVWVIDGNLNKNRVVASAHSSNYSVHFFGAEPDRLRDLAHEIGVMCGLPVLGFDDNGSPINDMDTRYQRYMDAEEKEKGLGINANEPALYALENLDENLGTRDFANGKLADNRSESESAGELYRICRSKLFDELNFGYVLDFFDRLMSEPASASRVALHRQILENPEFLALYFAARLMDKKSVDYLPQDEPLYQYFLHRLLERSQNEIEQRRAERTAEVDPKTIEIAVKTVFSIKERLTNAGMFAEAAALLDNIIAASRHETTLIVGADAGTAIETVSELVMCMDIATLSLESSSLKVRAASRLCVAVKRAVDILPEEYRDSSCINYTRFAGILEKATSSVFGLSKTELEKEPLFIFTKIVAFDNGLLPYLGRIAESRIKVAVIYNTDEERRAIEELNKGKSQDQQVIAAISASQISTKIRNSKGSKCYYFRMEGEKEGPGIGDVVVTDLRIETVKKIIDALGELSGIAHFMEKMKNLREAGKLVREAA